ncbi:HTH domain-containing protein [Paenibacillus sp. BJ-4]|uniref:HTH domain-containing protein n=1 Tax=Paenibacillus sp. BJ-4 TaxID=2878097 RepID=UPI001CF0B033|nr:helix-turn-helix domain-containing protein [Paenibacillus sp. BJ-4]
MRIFDILHLLAAQQIIKGEHLANELNVSTRTIRTDLKELDTFLSEHGATIKSLKGTGYKLEIWLKHYMSAVTRYKATSKICAKFLRLMDYH